VTRLIFGGATVFRGLHVSDGQITQVKKKIKETTTPEKLSGYVTRVVNFTYVTFQKGMINY
jgi:hypothetical protein